MNNINIFLSPSVLILSTICIGLGSEGKSGSGDYLMDDEEYNYEEGSAIGAMQKSSSSPHLSLIAHDDTRGEDFEIFDDDDDFDGSGDVTGEYFDDGIDSMTVMNSDKHLCDFGCLNNGSSFKNPAKLMLMVILIIRVTVF